MQNNPFEPDTSFTAYVRREARRDRIIHNAIGFLAIVAFGFLLGVLLFGLLDTQRAEQQQPACQTSITNNLCG